MTEHAIPSWRHKAACRDEDPELFFPLPSASAVDARKVCKRCPVRRDCGEAANRAGDSGVRAAFRLPEERDKLRKYLGLDARVCERCGGSVAVGNRISVCYDCTAAARSDRADATDARRHLQSLRNQGFLLVEIATATGVNTTTLSKISRGVSAHASLYVIDRVLEINPGAIRRAVDA